MGEVDPPRKQLKCERQQCASQLAQAQETDKSACRQARFTSALTCQGRTSLPSDTLPKWLIWERQGDQRVVKYVFTSGSSETINSTCLKTRVTPLSPATRAAATPPQFGRCVCAIATRCMCSLCMALCHALLFACTPLSARNAFYHDLHVFSGSSRNVCSSREGVVVSICGPSARVRSDACPVM